MSFELTDSRTFLKDLPIGKWHYMKGSYEQSNDLTAIMVFYKNEMPCVYVQYIGGEFMLPFIFTWELSVASINECWQYEFSEDFPEDFDFVDISMDWVNDFSYIAYTMLHDLGCSPIHCYEEGDLF